VFGPVTLINNDAIPDLVVAEGSSSAPTIDLFLGNGDSTFQPPFVISVPTAGGELAEGDVRGNGQMDVITNTGYLLLGNGDGTLQDPVYHFPGQADPPLYVSAADLNGDGKTDLVFSNDLGPASNIAVLISNGDGTFSKPPTQSTRGPSMRRPALLSRTSTATACPISRWRARAALALRSSWATSSQPTAAKRSC